VPVLAVEASRDGELLEEATSRGGLAWFAATAAVRPSRPPRSRFRVPRRRRLCPSPRRGGGCSLWSPPPSLRPVPPPAPASIRPRAEGCRFVVAAAATAASSPAAAAAASPVCADRR
jgi:hypothetical protein